MRYFYLKSITAALIAVIALCIGFKTVYPDTKAARNERYITSLINTLDGGNVHISSELIDISEHTVSEFNMKSVLDKQYIAKQFLGKNPVHNNDTEYSSGEGTVSFNKTQFTYTPNAPKFSADTKSITLANSSKIASRLCDEYGISTKDTHMEISGSDGGISVAVTQCANSLPIFNNAFIMNLSTDGLKSVTGVNFEVSDKNAQSRTALSMPDALIRFMHECTYNDRETIITDITLGYMLREVDNENTSVYPVWRIIVENSAVYYINA